MSISDATLTLQGASQKPFRMRRAEWEVLVKTALRHGWTPVGPLVGGRRPDPNESYFDQDGRIVTAADADALASALERAEATGVVPPAGLLEFLKSGEFAIQ